MLRISIHDDPGSVTFRLEGKLAGSWVRELEDCWRITKTMELPVRFDLTDVTFVDSAGKAFLAARHAQGAQLVASGCVMRAFIAEIATAQKSTPNCECRLS